MANDEDNVILPELDEHDIAAVIGLLIRVMRIDLADTRDQTLRDELNVALAERVPFRKRYVEAVGAFGFDTKSAGLWDRVRAAIGAESYSGALAAAKAAIEQEVQRAANQHDAAPGAQSRIDHSRTKADGQQEEKPDQQAPRISQAILEYLRSLGGLGAPVSVIKKHLSDTYGIETHQKTPGMTLYRLSKEGLVRRDGRSWFATDAVGGSGLGRSNSAVHDMENGD